MSLDKLRPYGIVSGHSIIRFQQDGKDYDGQGEELDKVEIQAKTGIHDTKKGTIILTDDIHNAKLFLLNILKDRNLSKAAVYKEAENNNQLWDSVRNAAAELGIVHFTYQKQEIWRLPENASADI